MENVLLIITDTLRRDRIGAYSGTNLTPNIDNIASEGEIFEKCFSCNNVTESSMTTIMTGLYPLSHGVLNHGTRVTDEELNKAAATTPIAERLSKTHDTIGISHLERWHKRGFDNYIHPNRNNGYAKKLLDYITQIETRVNLPVRNIATKAYNLHKSEQNNILSYASADMISDYFIENTRNKSRSWFSYLHFMDAHVPYRKMEEYPEEVETLTDSVGDDELENALEYIKGSEWEQMLKGMFGEDTTLEEIVRRYNAGAWHIDKQIGRIVEHLKTINEYDDTTIIITSDHGESLTEHQILFDHHGLYDPSIHVPLIVKSKGFEGSEQRFVQHYDIAPTILDLAGIEYCSDEFDGVSLVQDKRNLNRDAIFVEESYVNRSRAIRTDEYKYIKSLEEDLSCRYCGIEHASRYELYNLGEDEYESENVYKTSEEKVKELEEKEEEWISGLKNVGEDSVDFDIDIDKEQLEDLGYI